MTMLRMMAMMILISPNSALSARTVVKEPAPAINGNAIGTMEAACGAVSRWISIPRINSKAMMKITNAPATANDSTSIPINVRILVPKNKKEIIIKPATSVAFSDSMTPTRLLMLTKMGRLPKISMTANKTAKQVPISLREIFAKNSAIQLYLLDKGTTNYLTEKNCCTNVSVSLCLDSKSTADEAKAYFACLLSSKRFSHFCANSSE